MLCSSEIPRPYGISRIEKIPEPNRTSLTGPFAAINNFSYHTKTAV